MNKCTSVFASCFLLLAAATPATPQPGPGGPMGPPGGVQQKIRKKFDRDGNGWLDTDERKTARAFLAQNPARGGFFPRFGPGKRNRPEPGPKLNPRDVEPLPPTIPLYDPVTLRTLFLDFENPDWEKELADFRPTDVEVPATLTVDGMVHKNVGVRFRGMTSYFMVGEGFKRSLNLSMDLANRKQNLYGYRNLNLLNSHSDPTLLRTVLYYELCRRYIPAPRANFVRVVLNGESWGIYVNSQQVDKQFLKEWFGTSEGTRWKIKGSPGGGGGLEYLGEDEAPYRNRYTIKSRDDPRAWKALIRLCDVLNRTPAEKLEKALEPILDIDGTLKFLALDNACINNDGYWIRASDYYLYLDPKGRFHPIPHDANETFQTPGGPGFFGGGPRGVDLDPLYMVRDPAKPLLSKLLAVPALRKRYLEHVRTIAKDALDWKRIEPLARRYRELIAADVRKETRKLQSFAAFENGLNRDAVPERGSFGPPQSGISLESFFRKRQAFLLAYDESKSKPADPKTFAGGPGRGGPGKGGPGGFRRGGFLVQPLLKTLDSDRNGKVSRKEWSAGADRLFVYLDEKKAGGIDRKRFAQGIDEIFPPPPGFGPPGGGFGPPGGPFRNGPKEKGKPEQDPAKKGPGIGPDQGPGRAPPGGFPPFGPGSKIAETVFERAGLMGDAELTLPILRKAAEKLFAACDKNRDGSLDPVELNAAIDQVLPPPPRFRPFGPPPGFGPPGDQGGFPPPRTGGPGKEKGS